MSCLGDVIDGLGGGIILILLVAALGFGLAGFGELIAWIIEIVFD
jgi:hypothetical protein